MAKDKSPQVETQSTASATAVAEAEPKKSDALEFWRLWASKDCPEEAPTCGGFAFPKWTDPVMVGDDGSIITDQGGEARRIYQKGNVVRLRPSQVEAIKAKLAQRPEWNENGVLKCGKITTAAFENGRPAWLGPLGKWLHMERVEGPQAEQDQEGLQTERKLNALLKEQNELYRSAERESPVVRSKIADIQKQIDELEAKKRAKL